MTEERLDGVEVLTSLSLPKKIFDNRSDSSFLVYDEETLKVLNGGNAIPLASDTDEESEDESLFPKGIYPSTELPKELKEFEGDFIFTLVNKTLQVHPQPFQNKASFFEFIERLSKVIKICKSNRRKFKIKKVILFSIYNSEKMNSEKLVGILKKIIKQQRIYLSTNDRIFIEKLNRG